MLCRYQASRPLTSWRARHRPCRAAERKTDRRVPRFFTQHAHRHVYRHAYRHACRRMDRQAHAHAAATDSLAGSTFEYWSSITKMLGSTIEMIEMRRGRDCSICLTAQKFSLRCVWACVWTCVWTCVQTRKKCSTVRLGRHGMCCMACAARHVAVHVLHGEGCMACAAWHVA